MAICDLEAQYSNVLCSFLFVIYVLHFSLIFSSFPLYFAPHQLQDLFVHVLCSSHDTQQYIRKLETLQSSASERPRYMPKAAAIHYLKCMSQWQNWVKIIQKANTAHCAKCESSRSSRWHTGTGKPKSMSMRFDFLRRSRRLAL